MRLDIGFHDGRIAWNPQELRYGREIFDAFPRVGFHYRVLEVDTNASSIEISRQNATYLIIAEPIFKSADFCGFDRVGQFKSSAEPPELILNSLVGLIWDFHSKPPAGGDTG